MNQDHNGTGHNINLEKGDAFIGELPRHLSHLSAIVNELGKNLNFSQDNEEEDLTSFNISEKILYNNILRFKPILDEYRIFVGKLGIIYSEFDKEGTNKTFTILTNIRLHYLQVREEFLSKQPDETSINVIRRNADNIIDAVESRLFKEIERSSNINETIESIKICIQVILIDAFMRCKILEEPVK